MPLQAPLLERRGPPAGTGAARAAFAMGVLYALVSAYWGAGGTWLLDTIGGTLERAGRAQSADLLAVVWIIVVLKLVAAAVGLVATSPRGRRRRRPSRIIAWVAAVVLVHRPAAAGARGAGTTGRRARAAG